MATKPPNDSVEWKVLLGSIVSVVLATIAVGARLAARRLSAAGYWWDDYTIVAALVVQWGMGICRWLIVGQWNYGHHTVYISKDSLRHFQKIFIAIQVTYFTNAVLTKTSLLFLYGRIFGVVKCFRVALWISAAVVVAYWIPTTMLAFLGCTPIQRNWDKTVPGHCVNLVSFFRWNGICNLLIDVLVLCLPLPMVWRLSVPLKQRLQLCLIFLLGVFVCITSIMRVLSYKPHQLNDSTYSGADSMTWSIVEQGIGIVCACLPTLRPLLIAARGRSSRNTNTKDSSQYGMDNFRSAENHRGNVTPGGGMIGGGRSLWKAGGGGGSGYDDSDSTVGFAKLQDDEMGVGMPMSPADVQRSVYAPMPIGAAVTTNATKGSFAQPIGGGEIMKETRIDQKSELADGSSGSSRS